MVVTLPGSYLRFRARAWAGSPHYRLGPLCDTRSTKQAVLLTSYDKWIIGKFLVTKNHKI